MQNRNLHICFDTESNPKCSNTSTSVKELDSSAYAQFWCAVNFAGSLSPVMKWVECNGLNITSGDKNITATNNTVNNTTNNTLTFQWSGMTKDLKHFRELTCTCQISFDAPEDTNQSYATNAPYYNHVCTSVINIHDQYGKCYYYSSNLSLILLTFYAVVLRVNI